MFPNSSVRSDFTLAIKRVRLWYALLILILCIFTVRLFYLQVIRHDHYKASALSDQLKQYQIPANRGTIEAHDGDAVVPLVLNQKLYTLYADPTYIKNADSLAIKIAKIIGGDATTYKGDLTAKDTRYSILGKKLTEAQNKQLVSLKAPGLGTQEQDYRTYPQGSLAAQLLGFVNNDGIGTYGIEQALNGQLKGTPGELKAITDINGVPLAASSNNVMTPAVHGKQVTLTIDLGIQKQVEAMIADGVQKTKASGGSVVVMDTNTGAIKAMANYPTYDPGNYAKVSDANVFNNAAVTSPIEIGSIMKTFTTAAALDQGVIQPNTTYFDPSHWLVDGFNITNIEEDGGAGTRSIADLLNLSLNTGATWELMQMGGGQIDTKGRTAWYNYMANHYRFGKATGIEQGYESTGIVPGPKDNGAGIDLTYANTSFGQAMTATPIQVASAMSAVLNGGTYYQPHLVDQLTAADGKTLTTASKVLGTNVVSAKVGQAMVPLMQYVVEHHNIVPAFDQNRYSVGGKTGTAQIAKQGGGYREDVYNGTYLGFVGGDKPQYTIAVFIDKPIVSGGAYAGTAAAQPVFTNIAHMLINNAYVSPKTP
jgi:cell division protein FtsI/penicillin-binding protein 2